MTHTTAAVVLTLSNALDSDFGHVHIRRTLVDLDWCRADEVPEGAPHSIYQIVRHLIFWQEFLLRRLSGEAAPAPTEDFWPASAAPADEQEWSDVRTELFDGLDRAHRFAREGGLEESLPLWPDRPRMDAVRIIASHTSYHTGQIVLLRRLLGIWPPSAAASV